MQKARGEYRHGGNTDTRGNKETGENIDTGGGDRGLNRGGTGLNRGGIRTQG